MYAMFDPPSLVVSQHTSNAKHPVDREEAEQDKMHERSRRRSRRSRVMVALLVQGDCWEQAHQEVAEQVMAGLAWQVLRSPFVDLTSPLLSGILACWCLPVFGLRLSLTSASSCLLVMASC